MHEPESGQNPVDSTLMVESPLSGVGEPMPAVESAPEEPFPGTEPNADGPLPGTEPNADEAEETGAESVAKKAPAPRTQRRLRFPLKLKIGLGVRRPSLPKVPLGWHTRFKVAVVLSFLILVSVLLVNRVTRGRHSPPSEQADGGPPTLMIQGQAQPEPSRDSAASGTDSLVESAHEPPVSDQDTDSPRFEVASRSLPVSDDPGPTTIDDGRLEAEDEEFPPPIHGGDGLIQASNSSLSPPAPVESRLSVASREPLEASIQDEPPLPAYGPEDTLASAPEPTDDDEEDPPALAGVNPPVRVAASEASAEPMSSDLDPPDSSDPVASLDESDGPQFGSFQDLPPPTFGMADSGLADTDEASDPAAEPASEGTELASQDPDPAAPDEPNSAETLLQPPVDSLEGLETPALAQRSEPSVEPEPADLDVNSAPGSLIARPDPSTDLPAVEPSPDPSTAAVAPEPTSETPEPEPAEPPALAASLANEAPPEPEPAESPTLAANPTPPAKDPVPSTPPSTSSKSAAPSEPGTLVLAEVPKRSTEPDQTSEVVGGKIEPITHVVRRGENFFTIARYYYGSGRFYRALWKANTDRVPKIDELYIGTLILVPPPEDLDKAYIDPPGPRPTIGSSPSSSVSPGGPSRSRPERDDRAERAAASHRERNAENRDGIELSLPRVVPASASLEPLFPDSDSDWPSGSIPSPRSGMRVHIVRPHETLRSIAREELGDSRWESELLRLNTDQVENPHNLEVGLRLRLPEGTRRD